MKVNLQLFAAADEGRTEKATPKKRQDARKKGQVLQSREITASVGLLSVFLGLKVFGSYIYGEISIFIAKIFREYINVVDVYSYNKLRALMIEVNIVLLKTILPLLGIAFLSAFISGYAQVGFLFTSESIKIKFSKLNPMQGLKRIFSTQSVVQLIKSIVKVVIIAFMGYSYLKNEQSTIAELMDMDTIGIAAYIGYTIINIAIRMCVVLLLLSVADYLYQWWDFEKNLKMTKQEVKEEYKQMEGNPEVKAKIRQKQRQMSMRRMLHDVPKADVIITNPEHFAVAIRYDESVNEAPILIAKGQDYIAQRIKEVARENQVEIIENKPLARSIYSMVEIGEAIPRELYQAVAEVLAFVYSMKKGGGMNEA